MDKTLLKLEIGKWNEACRFLKSKQTELSTAEWTAIETLADYWRKKFGCYQRMHGPDKDS